MSQTPVNPYAPPKANVMSHSDLSQAEVYRDGKYLVLSKGAELPPFCVRSGEDVNESNGERKEVTIYRNLKWRERKWWVNLLMLIAMVMIMLGVIVSVIQSLEGSSWLLLVAGAALLRALSKVSMQPYSITISFSNDYLRFEKIFRTLLYVAVACICAVSLVYLLLDGSLTAKWTLISIFLLGSLLKDSPLVVKKEEGDFLYITWAEKEFLDRLPQKPF